MILIMVMQEFDRKLAEISGLIRSMDSEPYRFERDAIKMVMDLEMMAETYGLPIQAELALVRGKLICGCPEDKSNRLPRKERSKEKQRYIIAQLTEAIRLAEEYFDRARKQFEECEQVCGQIIINAYYRGLQKQKQDLYLLVSQDEELGPHMAKVNGAVGCANTRVIFEQAKVYTRYDV